MNDKVYLLWEQNRDFIEGRAPSPTAGLPESPGVFVALLAGSIGAIVALCSVGLVVFNVTGNSEPGAPFTLGAAAISILCFVAGVGLIGAVIRSYRLSGIFRSCRTALPGRVVSATVKTIREEDGPEERLKVRYQFQSPDGKTVFEVYHAATEDRSFPRPRSRGPRFHTLHLRRSPPHAVSHSAALVRRVFHQRFIEAR